MKNIYRVEEISWEDIKKIWEEELWPHKKNGVSKANEWTWKWNQDFLGKDKEMAKTIKPTFFGIYCCGKIVGVNSGFISNIENIESKCLNIDGQPDVFIYYRSRGLWVKPSVRRQGLSQLLLRKTIEKASISGCNWIWSVPRKSALGSYEKIGFKKISNWFYDAQYGPNCIATKYL